MATGNNHFRGRCAQFVQGLFEYGGGMTAAHYDHGFEAVGLDVFTVVSEQINAYPAHTRRGFTDGALYAVLFLDLALFIIAVIFEVFIKQDIKRFTHHIGANLAALVDDAYRGTVFNGFVDFVLIDIAPKRLIHLLGFK